MDWRSDTVRTNCLFWAIRQRARRGGQIVCRIADPAGQRVFAAALLFGGIGAGFPGWWGLTLGLVVLAGLTWHHWGWRSKAGHLYHFQPRVISAMPFILTGYIQLEKWRG